MDRERRADFFLVIINPSGTARTADIPWLAARTARPLEASRTAIAGRRVETAAFGYGVSSPAPTCWRGIVRVEEWRPDGNDGEAPRSFLWSGADASHPWKRCGRAAAVTAVDGPARVLSLAFWLAAGLLLTYG